MGLLRDFPPTPSDEPQDFDAALEDAFAMGSANKIIIATPRGFKTLETWARRH
jgi:hypothetical protein